MVKDGKPWLREYASHVVKKQKHTFASPVKRRRIDNPHVGVEPMVLLEEYRLTVNKIKELNKTRKQLKDQLAKHGLDPTKVTRGKYFEKNISLYVLKLTDNCWYIGMSRDVDRRFKAHKKGKSLWTREHKPIEIFEVIETDTNSDSEAGLMEDQLTIEYAKIYGTEFVRGGGYCQRKPRWPYDLR